jgi:hypothetical protein
MSDNNSVRVINRNGVEYVGVEKLFADHRVTLVHICGMGYSLYDSQNGSQIPLLSFDAKLDVNQITDEWLIGRGFVRYDLGLEIQLPGCRELWRCDQKYWGITDEDGDKAHIPVPTTRDEVNQLLVALKAVTK